MGYTTSPLRYPGGKTRLSNFIKQIIIDNDLFGGDYVEAYAGGAGIAWSLLFDGFVSTVHLNDLNESLFAFWHSVFYETDALCELIRSTPVTMEVWHQQKKLQDNPSIVSKLELGFSTFFLNRTNRSGIIWAGVIGGKKQDGDYKLNARFNKSNLIERIEKIAKYKDRVKIYNQDALAFIRDISPYLPTKTLIYLDPPYYNKGAGLYEHHYQHNDHVTISKAIANVNRNWLVSYDNTSHIQEIYKGYRNIVYLLSYSTANRYSGSEVIFFSPGLVVSNTKNPLAYKKPAKNGEAFRQMLFET